MDTNWRKAEQLYKLCLQEAKDTNSDTTATLKSLEGLAAVYCQIDKVREAQPLYEEALALVQKETSEYVLLMLDLASCYESQGMEQKAEPLYYKVLEVNDKINGEHSAIGAQAMHKLALHYYKVNKLKKSQALFKKALPKLEEILGPSHSTTASCLKDYSNLLHKMNKEEEANALANKLQDIAPHQTESQESTPLTAPESAWTTGLQDTHSLQANKQENESARLTTDAYPESLDSMFNTLITVSSSQKRYDQAESLYKKVITIDEQSLGQDHPSLAADLNNLALLYISQKRYGEAEQLLQRVLAIYQKSYGADNLAVINCQINIAKIYEHQGQYQLAESLYKESLSKSEKLLGNNKFQTAKILNCLAFMYYKQGNYLSAEATYQSALSNCEAAFGQNSNLVAACLEDYAKVLRALGKTSQADELLSRAQKIFSATN